MQRRVESQESGALDPEYAPGERGEKGREQGGMALRRIFCVMTV